MHVQFIGLYALRESNEGSISQGLSREAEYLLQGQDLPQSWELVNSLCEALLCLVMEAEVIGQVAGR